MAKKQPRTTLSGHEAQRSEPAPMLQHNASIQPNRHVANTRGAGSAGHAPSHWQRFARTLRTPAARRYIPLLVAFLLGLLPGIYLYHQAKGLHPDTLSPSASSLQTTADVVRAVSRHILLPSGEQPTVATVTDASKVRSQAFFANAASGDKVLVYAQAKKAYLYRPGIDRIVEVAPLAPSQTPTADTNTSQ